MKLNKGFAYLLPLAIGLISLSVGIALAFLIPEVVLASLNSTGIMNTGTCYSSALNTSPVVCSSGRCGVISCTAYNTTPSECGELATNCCTYQCSCCQIYQTYQNAQTAINSVRALGFVVIIISVIWVLIALISGKKGGTV